MRRTKLITAAALAVVAALIYLALLPPSKRDFPQSKTLPDGSVLTVKFISTATNSAYIESTPKAWKLAIGRWLPYALAARVGWRFRAGGFLNVTMPDGGLAIFTTREGPGKFAPDQIRVIVLDEEGNTFGAHTSGSTTSIRDAAGSHYHCLQAWVVPAFPRRGKTLLVRFLQQRGPGQADVPVAEFPIANPQPGPYPDWTPDPWPATKKVGDLAVTLTDFTTGLSEHQPMRAAAENEMVATRLTFDLQQSGQTQCPWQVKSVALSDATGNHWGEPSMAILRPADPKNKIHEGVETCTSSWPGNLWPGESAWKLRVELLGIGDRPPDSLTRLSGIPLPPAGSNAPLSITADLDSFSFHLQRIEWLSKQHDGATASLSYAIDEMPDGFEVSLFKVSDEQGRPISIIGPKELSRFAGSFHLEAPTNATRLNCTFAMRKNRFVEFMAAPKRPK